MMLLTLADDTTLEKSLMTLTDKNYIANHILQYMQISHSSIHVEVHVHVDYAATDSGGNNSRIKHESLLAQSTLERTLNRPQLCRRQKMYSTCIQIDLHVHVYLHVLIMYTIHVHVHVHICVHVVNYVDHLFIF